MLGRMSVEALLMVMITSQSEGFFIAWRVSSSRAGGDRDVVLSSSSVLLVESRCSGSGTVASIDVRKGLLEAIVLLDMLGMRFEQRDLERRTEDWVGEEFEQTEKWPLSRETVWRCFR